MKSDRELEKELQCGPKVPERVHVKMEAVYESLPEKKRVLLFPKSTAAVAAALIVVLLGAGTVTAAVYTHWTRGLSGTLQADETTMERAERIGLSETPAVTVPEDIITATDQGVTVTAAQSIVDSYMAYLSFKVEGFTVPEGEEPCFGQVALTVDGNDGLNWSASFYNGLTIGSDGRAMYDDGTPFETDENGNLIERFYDADGSLEYQIWLTGGNEGDFLDKEIDVTFRSLGTVEHTSFEPLLDGEWHLRWRLTGNTDKKLWSGSYRLEGTGITVTEMELTPISIRAVCQLDEYWAGHETLESFPAELTGVKLKDGTLYLFLADGGSEGYLSQGELLYQMHYATDRILDPEQVEAFLFWKEPTNGEEVPTEENFYVVPIR